MTSPATIAPQAGHQIVTVAALFAAYFGGIGVFLPFFPVWLQSIGLNPTWIAILVATPLLVRVATTSFVADWAQRFADPRRPLRTMALAAVVTFALIPFAPFAPDLIDTKWVLLAIVAAMAVGWNAVLPLTDALAIQISRATGVAYGGVRLWGSLSFIVVSLLAGWVVGGFGVATVPWIMLVFLILFYAISLALPASLCAEAEGTGSGAKRRSGWVFFLRRRGAKSVFLGVGLIQASHATLYGFGSLSWGQQGFSELSIGLLWSFGVMVEIILFALSRPLIERIGARGLLLVGGVGAMIRWTALAFTPALVITLPLQALHGLSFAMTYLAMITYVSRRARPSELRGAQGVFTVVSGAIMGLATLAAGPLFETFGAQSYLCMTAMAMLGTVILLVNRLRVPGAGTQRMR